MHFIFSQKKNFNDYFEAATFSLSLNFLMELLVDGFPFRKLADRGPVWLLVLRCHFLSSFSSFTNRLTLSFQLTSASPYSDRQGHGLPGDVPVEEHPTLCWTSLFKDFALITVAVIHLFNGEVKHS